MAEDGVISSASASGVACGPGTDGDGSAGIVALFDARKAAAIQDAEEMRDTHVRWRDYLKACPKFDQTHLVGTLSEHEECIAKYDRILYVLNYSLTPEPKRAATVGRSEAEAPK